MKKHLPLPFIVGLLILVAALLACGTDANTGTSTGNGTPGNSSPGATTQPAKHFKPDEKVTVGKTWEVVVKQPTTSPGEQYISPKAGNIFLLIDTTFKNVTDKEQSLYGSANWKLKDPDGQTYNTAYLPSANTSASGKVEPGGPAKGTLVYEVPETAKAFTLAFESNAFSGGQTIWDLTL